MIKAKIKKVFRVFLSVILVSGSLILFPAKLGGELGDEGPGLGVAGDVKEEDDPAHHAVQDRESAVQRNLQNIQTTWSGRCGQCCRCNYLSNRVNINEATYIFLLKFTSVLFAHMLN